MTNDQATIFALATAPGRAGIAVFRISGPLAGPALEGLTGRATPGPRRAVRARFKDLEGQPLDDGLALWFPSPASFTGEDVVELHVHGGRAVREGIAEALLSLGLRPAEAGEFSRRAVFAGKLDLTRAEAIADLVEAETSAQRRQALKQLDGALEAAIEGWRDALLHQRAHLEAEIDFSDQDLPPGLSAAARAALTGLADEMAKALASASRSERLREGFLVALVGAPNAGKSSLLNRIAGREVAITAATPGTTRDVIEVSLDLDGYPVILADTAGLREDAGPIEQEGIRRARDRAAGADLTFLIVDSTAPEFPELAGTPLLIANKIDLAPPPPALAQALPVSATRGDGIDELLRLIAAKAAEALEAGPGPALSRQRHRAAVTEAELALRRAVKASLPELAAEDVRVAADALGRITGRVDIEQMLGVIFSEFCIGK